MHAVVPVKKLLDAKQRLAAVLSSQERQELTLAMLEDVLEVLAEIPAMRAHVITADDEVATLAASRGAAVIPEPEPEENGLNQALRHAAERLHGGGGSLIVVPGDVPALTADDLHRVVASLADGAAFVLVSDRHGHGTNCHATRPPGSCPYLFGPESFDRHREAARERGIEPVELELPSLQLDIDTPEDLLRLLRAASSRRASAVLRATVFAQETAARAGEATPC